jgi:hypothetical protein
MFLVENLYDLAHDLAYDQVTETKIYSSYPESFIFSNTNW